MSIPTKITPTPWLNITDDGTPSTLLDDGFVSTVYSLPGTSSPVIASVVDSATAAAMPAAVDANTMTEGPRTLVWTGDGTAAFSDAGNWEDITDGNSPASWAENSTDSVIIGAGSLAAVTIGAGSSNAAASAVIANAATASGSSLSVSGAGSALAVSGAVTVGQSGEGLLSVTQGGAVSAGSAALGAGSGSDGLVTIQGTGSALTVTGTLAVGATGTGELDVLGGASATVGNLDIGGSAASATGNVDVEGTGSALNVTGTTLDIGTETGGGAVFTIGAGTSLNFNGSIVETGKASFNDNGGTIDPASVSYSGTSNTLTGTLLVQEYIDTAGTADAGSGITIQNGTATVTSPLVILGDSVSDAENNINNSAAGAGVWTIGEGGSLVFNANLVDAGQYIDFSNGDTDSSLVIGQVVDGFTAGGNPNTGVAGTDPTIAPGAENLLAAGGFQATIENYQAGDKILLNGATATSYTVDPNGVLSLAFAGGGTATLNFVTAGRQITPASATILTEAGEQITGQEAACYRRGTRIRTLRGEVPIEQLELTDEVLTASGRRRPVRWLGVRRIDCRRHPRPSSVWPIRIEAGALGARTPMRDLWVSPGHSLYLEGVLIQAENLVNDATIVQMPEAEVQYWHVELDAHDLVLAEGAAAESYLDTGNRTAFVNGGAYVEAYPDFKPKHWSETCVPLILEGETVVRARNALLARARELGYRITADTDLHVHADGMRIEPTRLTDRRMAFSLPADCVEVELRTRTFVPSRVIPSSQDARALGVCVGRLRIDGVEWPLDATPLFHSGWHALERCPSGATHRWTQSCVALPAGTRSLILDIASPSHCWAKRRSAPLAGEAHRAV